MVDVTEYMMGDYLTAEIVAATPGHQRKLVVTKAPASFEEFPDRQNPSDTVSKLVVPVVFNGKKVDWVVSKTSARRVSKVLGPDTDQWAEAVIDVDTRTKGAVTFVEVKDVYNTKAVPPMRKP